MVKNPALAEENPQIVDQEEAAAEETFSGAPQRPGAGAVQAPGTHTGQRKESGSVPKQSKPAAMAEAAPLHQQRRDQQELEEKGQKIERPNG